MTSAPYSGKSFVLNVDDDRIGRYARTRLITRAGFTVKDAGTGTEALALAREQPVVIVLDVQLPDIGGLEVCRRLKADPATADIPVIHVSAAFVSDNDRAQAMEGGADAYLCEPVDPAVLVATIKAMARLRRMIDVSRGMADEWRATFDAIHEGVALISADGRVLRANRPLCQMLSMPTPTFAELRDLFPTSFEVWPPTERCVRDFLVGQYWYEVALEPGNAPAHGILTVRDVTDRKLAEIERHKVMGAERAARRRAEESARIKDEFLAVVSHELRTPLTAVMGWARILKNGAPEPQVARHALDVIERNVRAQAKLIDDLLDVSQIVVGKLALQALPVDLADVVRSALEAERPAAEARKIELAVGTLEPAVVTGDADRLRQVVVNLLSNAVKFTPSDGRIVASVCTRGDEARIEITDNGRGIAPEFLPYIFDRFRQADGSNTRTHRGLGLGLAIVRHLVEGHGGAVGAHSDGEGRGSTFVVRLPLAAATANSADALPAATEPAEGAAAAPARRLEGLDVLLVEDNPDSRELLRLVLEQSGATVREADSAESARRRLAERTPDVVLCDIGLPYENGLTLMRQLRRRQDALRAPAVALTAYAREEDRESCREAGFQMHMAKPVDPIKLVRAIVGLVRGGGPRGPVPGTPRGETCGDSDDAGGASAA